MPTYPGQSGSSTQLTVDAKLKQPAFISREIGSLVSRRLGAYRLCVIGSPDQVAGGAMHYERDADIYVDRDPRQTGPRGKWPRATWTEEARSEAVKEYGLEVPITNLAIRYNKVSQLLRAERMLTNRIVKFIDNALITAILADSDIQTANATVDWTDTTKNFIPDITGAQTLIETDDKGYDGFENAVLVLNTIHRDTLLNNDKLSDKLPRETPSGPIKTGFVAPFLGLKDILYLSQMPEDKALVLDNTTAIDFAGSEPDPAEGFQAYRPEDGTGVPLWVKVYKEEPKDTIIAGAIWPAWAIVAPKAIVCISDINSAS